MSAEHVRVPVEWYMYVAHSSPLQIRSHLTCQFFCRQLRSHLDNQVRRYLAANGISKATLGHLHNHLRACSQVRSHLHNHLYGALLETKSISWLTWHHPRSYNHIVRLLLYNLSIVAALHAASCLGVSQHHHHYTESINQSSLYSYTDWDYIWELSSVSNYYKTSSCSKKTVK